MAFFISIYQDIEKVMKKVIRCTNCSLCAIVQGCGFVAQTRYVCTQSSWDVDEDDGCTFGKHGSPQTGIVPCDVRIVNYKPALPSSVWW